MKNNQFCTLTFANGTCKHQYSSLKLMDNTLYEILEATFHDEDILSVQWYVEKDSMVMVSWDGYCCIRRVISYNSIEELKNKSNWRLEVL